METSHIVGISQILTDLCFTKQRIKTKNAFARVVCSVLVEKNNKKMCLNINRAQSVRLQKGTIEFKNYFKQMPVSFKIYADFECNLKNVESYKGSQSKKYQDYVPCSFAYNLVWVDDKFSKSIVFRGENAVYEFVQAILKEFGCCKKVMKKHFDLIMSEEEQFQSSSTWWICEKCIDNGD